MHRVLEYMLCSPPEAPPLPGVEAWWARHGHVTGGFEATVERAMVGGYSADRPGWAFASGYQEALRALVGDLGGDKVAMCATEKGGGHPSAIATRLVADGTGWRMSGRKEFTTLGAAAERLLVVASEGTDDAGRNRLALVSVPASRDGVAVLPGPELPFVPEVPHAVTEFTDVRVETSERLAGDGYSDYLKPFRTVEDSHVHAALVAWLLGVGRRAGWPTTSLERLCAMLCAIHSVSMASPSSSATHVALGGILSDLQAMIVTLEPLWSSVNPVTAAAWQRDQPLLGVAGRARAKRLEVAWQRLAQAMDA